MKKAIVIGASSGIGKDLALILAQNGYLVGLAGRRESLLKDLQKQIPSSFIKKMDICHPSAINLLNDLIHEMKGCDLIVINAGVRFPNPELVLEKELETIHVNVEGFVAIANTAIKYFITQKHGHLVGMSSIASIQGNPNAPAYNASKAFISNYLQGLRLKVYQMKIPITITDIRPGYVQTSMTQKSDTFWLTSSQKASQQIFQAIYKKKKIAYITKKWRLIALLYKILPETTYLKFKSFMFK